MEAEVYFKFLEGIKKEILMAVDSKLLEMQVEGSHLLLGVKTQIVEEIKDSLDQPQYLNKSKISRMWAYGCQSQIKNWQLPDFGIPTHFNGRSPMYKRSDVIEILNNPLPYKQKWMRLTTKEKIEIHEQFKQLKIRDEALAC